MPHKPSHRWEDRESEYRSEWEGLNPSLSWNDARYGHRYGWEMGADERYRGREWSDVESDLSTGWTDWSTRNRAEGSMGRQMEQSWENIKENVRHGWERAKREWNELTS